MIQLAILNTCKVAIAVYVINCYLRLHPSGPNPYVPDAHSSHCRPTTRGLHWQIPP